MTDKEVYIATTVDECVGIEGVWDASVYSLEDVKKELTKSSLENYGEEPVFASEGTFAIDIHLVKVRAKE